MCHNRMRPIFLYKKRILVSNKLNKIKTKKKKKKDFLFHPNKPILVPFFYSNREKWVFAPHKMMPTTATKGNNGRRNNRKHYRAAFDALGHILLSTSPSQSPLAVPLKLLYFVSNIYTLPGRCI